MKRRVDSLYVASEYSKTEIASSFGLSRITGINKSRVIIEIEDYILIFQSDVLHPDAGPLHCFYYEYWYEFHGDEKRQYSPSSQCDSYMDWKNNAFVFPLPSSASLSIETHVIKEKTIHLFSRASAKFNRFMYMGEMTFEEIIFTQNYCDGKPDPGDSPERHVVLEFKDHDELPERESFWLVDGNGGTPSHCREL